VRSARNLLAVAALLPLAAGAGETARLDRSTERLDLVKATDVLVDPTCSLDAAHASAPPLSGRYVPLARARNLGFTSACAWVRVSLENAVPDPRTWSLTWSYPLVENLDLYVPGPGGYREVRGGLAIPPAERGIVHRGFLHEARVGLGPGERVELLLRVRTRAALLLGVDAWAPSSLDAFERTMVLVVGLNLGALIVLALLALYSFLTRRDQSSLWFFAVLVTFGAYQLAETGIAAAWLHPGAHAWNMRAPSLLASLAVASALAFARRFLDTRRLLPRLDEGGLLLAWATPAAGLAGLVSLRFANVAVALLGGAAMVLVAAYAAVAVASGSRAARYFLAAAATFLVGGMAFVLTVLGVLSPNAFSINGIHIGLTVAGVIFTFALADRLRALEGRARDELEGEVRARTRTLSETVEELRRQVDVRRRAEAARTETEERFRLAFKTSPDAIAIRRLEDGRYVAVNDGFVEATGFAASEAIGRTAEELGVWEAANWERLLAVLSDEGQARSMEVPIRRRDGEVRAGVVSANVVTVDGEPLVLSIVRDVTEQKRADDERRRLEDELKAAQRMEAVGRLAAGVAHHFNNLLTAISSQVAIVLMETPEGHPGRAAILEIQDAVQGAATFTRQLLALGRRQVLEMRPASLNALVSNLGQLLGRLVGEHVDLSLDLAPELPAVLCDGALVEQVLLNLVVRARDAMPTGGGIRVSTGAVVVAPEAATAERRPGRYVVLSVADSGPGMDEETLRHVFEPFFPTATVGELPGLGLSAVHAIARQHGGFAEAESREGRGSTFRVLLPAADVAAAPARSLEGPALPGGGETILLAEDEREVRERTASLLERLGYRVHAAPDGRAALELAERLGGGVDLLVTDVVLPRMGGRELARAIRARWPRVRFLFLSGYAAEALAVREVAGDGFALLAKPWSAAALAAKLREVLGGA